MTTLDGKTVWVLPYYVGPNDRLIVWRELNARVHPPVKGGCDMKAIVEAVSWVFAVPCEDLLSTRGPANVSRARQVCCYLGRRLTSRSLPHIGGDLGGRDHTTVLYGIIRIEELREVNDELNKMIFKCEVILQPSETLP